MKKFLTLILSLLCVIACAIGLSACFDADTADSGDNGGNTQQGGNTQKPDDEKGDEPSKPDDGKGDGPSKPDDGKGDEPSKPDDGKDKHEHSLTAVAAKAATHTENGNIAYYVCNDCGSWFSDEAGKNEIWDKSSVVIAKGHTYEDGVCTECGAYLPTEGLQYSLWGEVYRVTGIGTAVDTDIRIADEYNERPVTAIERNAFKDCTNLTGVTIPDTITDIGYMAFGNCTGLKNVSLGNGVTVIGMDAFYNCSSLTEITIPASVTIVGTAAFVKCDSLTSIKVAEGNTNYIGINNSVIERESKTLVVGSKDGIIPDDGSVTAIGDSAFMYYESLTSVTIPETVTTIGKDAFYGCLRMSSVTLPDSLTLIDEQAFRNTGLISMTIPAGYVSGYVCAENEYLKEVTFGNGVRTIGTFAFAGCTALESLEFSDNVGSIYQYAFWNCTGLKSISMGSGISSIGESAFGGCTGLEELYIKDIANWCEISFYSLHSNPISYAKTIYIDGERATSITIPSQVEDIGTYVFAGYESLTEVTIEDGVEYIRAGAFEGCINLEKINIPASVKSLVYDAFEGCDKLITSEDGVKYVDSWVIGCDSSLTQAIIKEGTTGITTNAFKDCTELKSVTIPDSIIYILVSAFQGCNNIESATLPSNALHGILIGDLKTVVITGGSSVPSGAFNGCTKLTSATVNTYQIESGAFYGCTNLSQLILRENLQYIGPSAFANCVSLKSLIMPAGLNLVDETAFYGCDYIESATVTAEAATSLPSAKIRSLVVISDSEVIIKENAFYNFGCLESVVISENVAGIGDYAFSKCSNLSSVTLAPSVYSIGMYAFAFCDGLKSITIPDTVRLIGEEIFFECHNLESVTAPSNIFLRGITSLKTVVLTSGEEIRDYAFAGCSLLTSITIPDSVTHVGEEAFYMCQNLVSVTCNSEIIRQITMYATNIKSVVITGGYRIVSNAFNSCTGLESVVLSDSITTIEEFAFYGCTGLKSIYISSNVTSMGYGVFYYCDNLTIYCEAESKPMGWNNSWSGECTVVWGYKGN